MSYEGDMLAKFAMPTKQQVEDVILTTLFQHSGTIREFAAGEDIVNEIADKFDLNAEQRAAVLERIYRKDNRIVKTPLWHRLLYRAADALAKEKLVTRPTSTVLLTNKKEWMLTEKGFDAALDLLGISPEQKGVLPTKSFEVQKEVKRIIETPCPENYNPLRTEKRKQFIAKELTIRARGFRQAVIESYDCRCCVCGLKLQTPDQTSWEVEAAHIVPHSANGKDDIWNGIALCRIHHWAFDVGWFTLTDDWQLLVSSKIQNVPGSFGMIHDYDYIRNTLSPNRQILLPSNHSLYPHKNSLAWHREYLFYKQR
jgi:hypothetical protein